MDSIQFINLMAVTVIALVTPLLASLVPRAVRVPAVVLEIVAGVIIGPSGLGWVHIDAPVDILSLLGFSFRVPGPRSRNPALGLKGHCPLDPFNHH